MIINFSNIGSAGGSGGTYTLPIATANRLGGVKVGSGLTIDPSTGVLSASGGTGSNVSVEQTLSAGTKIGTITVDGAGTDLFAPEGGGGGGDTNYQIVPVLSAVTNPQEGTLVYVQSGSAVETWSGYSFNASALEDGAPVATITKYEGEDIFYTDFYDGAFWGNIDWENDGQLHYAEGNDYSGNKYKCAYIADAENKVFSIFMEDWSGLTAFADEGVVSGDTSTGVTVSWESGQFMYDGTVYVPVKEPRTIVNITDGNDKTELYSTIYGMAQSGMNINEYYVFIATVSDPDTYNNIQITAEYSYLDSSNIVFNGYSNGVDYKLTMSQYGYVNVVDTKLINKKTGTIAINEYGTIVEYLSGLSKREIFHSLLDWINSGETLDTLNEMFPVKVYYEDNGNYLPFGSGTITNCSKSLGQNVVYLTIQAPSTDNYVHRYDCYIFKTGTYTYNWTGFDEKLGGIYDGVPQTTVKYMNEDTWPCVYFEYGNDPSLNSWGVDIIRPDNIKIFETYHYYNKVLVMGQDNIGEVNSGEGVCELNSQGQNQRVVYDEAGNRYYVKMDFNEGKFYFFYPPEMGSNWTFEGAQGTQLPTSGETTGTVNMEIAKVYSGGSWLMKDELIFPKNYYLEEMSNDELSEMFKMLRYGGPKYPPMPKFARFIVNIEEIDGYMGQCEVHFGRFDSNGSYIVFTGGAVSRNSDSYYKRVVSISGAPQIVTNSTTEYSLTPASS